MIRITSPPSSEGGNQPWHEGFLAMLPAIQRQASIAFRGLPEEAREDLIEEVIAHAMIAYKALYDRGKIDLAYASVLCLYGIKRARIGRRVGMKLNCRDVSSLYCQRAKGINLERLDRFDRESDQWLQVLIEDRHAGPAETAAARIDVNDWFARLPRRDRQIAQTLALGTSTKEAARRFRVSPSRISQKRREYLQNWQTFQGEIDDGGSNSPKGRLPFRQRTGNSGPTKRKLSSRHRPR